MVGLSALVTLLPEKKAGVGGWVGAGARLDVLEKYYSSCQDLNTRSSSIYPSHLPTTLPHTDLKIIQKSIIIERNWSFGLDVFHSLLELLEGFCGRVNFR